MTQHIVNLNRAKLSTMENLLFDAKSANQCGVNLKIKKKIICASVLSPTTESGKDVEIRLLLSNPYRAIESQTTFS